MQRPFSFSVAHAVANSRRPSSSWSSYYRSFTQRVPSLQYHMTTSRAAAGEGWRLLSVLPQRRCDDASRQLLSTTFAVRITASGCWRRRRLLSVLPQRRLMTYWLPWMKWRRSISRLEAQSDNVCLKFLIGTAERSDSTAGSSRSGSTTSFSGVPPFPTKLAPCPKFRQWKHIGVVEVPHKNQRGYCQQLYHRDL